MRLARRLATALCLGGALASAAPAFADNLAGDWLMETSTFEGDCKIKGAITFTPGRLSNTYNCTFESEQICGPLNGNISIKVKQTCTAQKVGRQVAIKSAVAQILEVKPPGYQTNYLADNFVMAIQKNLNEMLGDHYDEVRELKARFWRDEQLIS